MYIAKKSSKEKIVKWLDRSPMSEDAQALLELAKLGPNP